jgi:hypothetical protein
MLAAHSCCIYLLTLCVHATHHMWTSMCMPDVVELANIHYTSSVELPFAPRKVALPNRSLPPDLLMPHHRDL